MDIKCRTKCDAIMIIPYLVVINAWTNIEVNAMKKQQRGKRKAARGASGNGGATER